MIRIFVVLILTLALAAPAAAKPRHAHRAACVPVAIEGVGTVWVSGRPPRRR